MTIVTIQSFALRRPDSPEPFLKLPSEGLEFTKPGVYTLEGPNQSGKSTFLKALVGALPAPIELTGEPKLSMAGATGRRLKSPRKAAMRGVVGVFQDDLLIPSLTVREQLILRHGRLRWRQLGNYARLAFYKIVVHPISVIFDLLQWRAASTILAKIKPKTVDWLDTSEIENLASEFLARIGQDPDEVLPMLPAQLSGGKKALAKIVATEIHFQRGVKPKILLLDEAFSGLQRDLWPVLLDHYRRWAGDTGGIVIAVTHNTAEVDMWRPEKKLRIENGKIVGEGLPPGTVAQIAIPRPTKSFLSTRLYSETASAELERFIKLNLKERPATVVIVSPHCVGLPAFQQLVTLLDKSNGAKSLVIPLATGAAGTDMGKLIPLIEQAIIHLKTDSGVLVVVGGGATINIGGFVASILFRGVCRLLVIPTTILAIADVVVGSKTSVPLITSGESVPAPLNLKHSVGTYHNPTWSITDPRYIDSLTVGETLIGFSEIVKHGLLQSDSMLDRALTFVLSTLAANDLQLALGDLADKSVPDSAIQFAEEAAALKAEALSLDPFEAAYARILLYGHLHAHCIERVSMFSIAHGVAVYLGMLIELRMSESRSLYTKLLPILQGSRSSWLKPLLGLQPNQLEAVYLTQNKRVHEGQGPGHGKYASLSLKRAGEFSLAAIARERLSPDAPYEIDAARFAATFVANHERRRTFAKIWSATVSVMKDLGVAVDDGG